MACFGDASMLWRTQRTDDQDVLGERGKKSRTAQALGAVGTSDAGCGLDWCCRLDPDDSWLSPPLVSRVVLLAWCRAPPSRPASPRILVGPSLPSGRPGRWIWQTCYFGATSAGSSNGVVKSRAKARHSSQLPKCSNGVGKAMILDKLLRALRVERRSCG